MAPPGTIVMNENESKTDFADLEQNLKSHTEKIENQIPLYKRLFSSFLAIKGSASIPEKKLLGNQLKQVIDNIILNVTNLPKAIENFKNQYPHYFQESAAAHNLAEMKPREEKNAEQTELQKAVRHFITAASGLQPDAIALERMESAYVAAYNTVHRHPGEANQAFIDSILKLRSQIKLDLDGGEMIPAQAQRMMEEVRDLVEMFDLKSVSFSLRSLRPNASDVQDARRNRVPILVKLENEFFVYGLRSRRYKIHLSQLTPEQKAVLTLFFSSQDSVVSQFEDLNHPLSKILIREKIHNQITDFRVNVKPLIMTTGMEKAVGTVVVAVLGALIGLLAGYLASGDLSGALAGTGIGLVTGAFAGYQGSLYYKRDTHPVMAVGNAAERVKQRTVSLTR